MRKILSGMLIGASMLIGTTVFAQGMMGGYATQPVDAAAQTKTAQEESAGKATWDKLQAKQVTCAELSDDNFDKLGDYFMGLMSGTSHAAMNEAMTQRLGDAGETQMHIAMGKRLSGCDANAALPAQGAGFFGMMGSGSDYGVSRRTANYGRYGMMGAVGSNSSFGMMGAGTYGDMFIVAHMITMVLAWTLMLAAIFALAKWTLKKK